MQHAVMYAACSVLQINKLVVGLDAADNGQLKVLFWGNIGLTKWGHDVRAAMAPSQIGFRVMSQIRLPRGCSDEIP